MPPTVLVARSSAFAIEVEHLHAAVVADHDVRRRDIAVNDVERLSGFATPFVRVMQAGRSTADDHQGELERNRPTAAKCRLEHRASVFAVHVFHRHVVSAVGLVDFVDLRDVLVVERRGEVSLRRETS